MVREEQPQRRLDRALLDQIVELHRREGLDVHPNPSIGDVRQSLRHTLIGMDLKGRQTAADVPVHPLRATVGHETHPDYR